MHQPSEQPPREQLLILLRSSPFHWWQSLREVMRDSDRGIFDATAAEVRAQWTSAERAQQLKKALTAVSVEAVQVLPDWTGSSIVPAHLDNAAAALSAASELVAESRNDPGVGPFAGDAGPTDSGTTAAGRDPGHAA